VIIMTARQIFGLFKSERALVTGSASSIGRGIAVALAREGAEVVLCDIDAARNAETQALIVSAEKLTSSLRISQSRPPIMTC
jgi:NAD(P)-dependent dehydrogenase (short-subunit alcohol dehydrogenase family)